MNSIPSSGTYGPDNGIWFARQWVPVSTDYYGAPYPNGGYYRSLGSYTSKAAAERAVAAAA
jgi:hypothetical protein